MRRLCQYANHFFRLAEYVHDKQPQYACKHEDKVSIYGQSRLPKKLLSTESHPHFLTTVYVISI